MAALGGKIPLDPEAFRREVKTVGSSGKCGIRPVLLRITSKRPCVAAASSAFTCAPSVTSVGRAACGPRPSSAASAWSLSSRGAPSTSLAPAGASAARLPRPAHSRAGDDDDLPFDVLGDGWFLVDQRRRRPVLSVRLESY
jgi:hypothetical protein